MSGEIITIIISALSAAIAAPIGAWVGRKLERDKYRIELDRLRAEMKDKLAEVKSHELENVRKAPDILMVDLNLRHCHPPALGLPRQGRILLSLAPAFDLGAGRRMLRRLRPCLVHDLAVGAAARI